MVPYRTRLSYKYPITFYTVPVLTSVSVLLKMHIESKEYLVKYYLMN
jgi:hypothetical protein